VTTHTELYHLDHKNWNLLLQVYRTVLAGKCIGFTILTYVCGCSVVGAWQETGQVHLYVQWKVTDSTRWQSS